MTQFRILEHTAADTQVPLWHYHFILAGTISVGHVHYDTLSIWLVFISLIVHRYTCTANACITMHLCNSTLIAGSCALQNWLTLSWSSNEASVRTTHLSKWKGCYIQSETDIMELAKINRISKLNPLALSTTLHSILSTIMSHICTFYFPHYHRYVWEGTNTMQQLSGAVVLARNEQMLINKYKQPSNCSQHSWHWWEHSV